MRDYSIFARLFLGWNKPIGYERSHHLNYLLYATYKYFSGHKNAFGCILFQLSDAPFLLLAITYCFIVQYFSIAPVKCSAKSLFNRQCYYGASAVLYGRLGWMRFRYFWEGLAPYTEYLVDVMSIACPIFLLISFSFASVQLFFGLTNKTFR